jgi:DNA-binding CsgD family transcriptional regulator
MQLYETFLSKEPFQPKPTTKNLRFANIPCFSDEATYVYSLKTKKILYAQGWMELLGYANEEISMHLLVEITTPDHKEFIQEMNNQALAFILSKSEHLYDYSCTTECKKFSKQGEEVALLESVKVHHSLKGKVVEVIGTYKRNPRTPHLGNKYFQASGPDIETLVEKMQQFEAHKEVFNKRECKIIRMLVNGKTIKEVAKEMFVSTSTIEKNLSELCRKFKVRNRAELIAYSHENGLI